MVLAPGSRGVEALRRGADVIALPPASPLELPADEPLPTYEVKVDGGVVWVGASLS